MRLQIGKYTSFNTDTSPLSQNVILQLALRNKANFKNCVIDSEKINCDATRSQKLLWSAMMTLWGFVVNFDNYHTRFYIHSVYVIDSKGTLHCSTLYYQWHHLVMLYSAEAAGTNFVNISPNSPRFAKIFRPSIRNLIVGVFDKKQKDQISHWTFSWKETCTMCIVFIQQNLLTWFVTTKTM